MSRPIVLPPVPMHDVMDDEAKIAWWRYDSMRAYARAAVEADRAGIAAVLLDIYKAAGGDSECTPDPSPEEVLRCVRDLRECYNDALAWNVPPITVTGADVDAAMTACTRAEDLRQGVIAALESYAARLRGGA